MTTKHTPAPWHIEPLATTQGADMAICAPNNGWIVAVIQHDPDIQTHDDPDFETVKWHDQDHANARLIAAAPDLLAQLKFALELLQDCTGLEDTLEPIVDAIAKAEGGEA